MRHVTRRIAAPSDATGIQIAMQIACEWQHGTHERRRHRQHGRQLDQPRGELVKEPRERITLDGGYGDITEDELKRLVGATSLGTKETLRDR